MFGRQLTRLFVALIVLWAGAACASPGFTPLAPAEGEVTDRRIRVEIENRYIGHVRVYLWVLGARSGRIATVYGHSARARFNPIAPLDETRLFIPAPRGEESWWSEPLIWLQPGDCVRLIVGQSIIHSFTLPCGPR